jgi:hypothetical protein
MLKKFAVLALVVVAATCVFAQTDTYYVNYFSNAHNMMKYDSTIRVVNPGLVGSPLSANDGAICADIYVFDTSQEMLECCSCPVTANGVIALSVDNDLTANPLTAVTLGNGVVKIVASSTTGSCANNELQPTPIPNLRAWATHVQFLYSGQDSRHSSGPYVVTETAFETSPLGGDELQFLGQACSFVQYLGSGAGTCACGTAE